MEDRRSRQLREQNDTEQQIDEEPEGNTRDEGGEEGGRR